MNLEETLKCSVSSQLHERLDEILSVVDKSLDYRIKYTKNLEEFSNLLKQRSKDGLDAVIDFEIKVLNGSIVLFPEHRYVGNFLCVIKQVITQSVEGEIKTVNYFIVYEKDWRLM